jgi:hypothetical protein
LRSINTMPRNTKQRAKRANRNSSIAGDPHAYVIACPECGATGPKQLPGVPVEVAIEAWNRRFGLDH